MGSILLDDIFYCNKGRLSDMEHKYGIACIMFIALSLTSCSNDLNNIDFRKNDDVAITTTTSLPDHAYVDKSASDKLASYGQESQDEWFIQNLLQSGIDINRDTIFADRDKICEDIKKGTTAGDIRKNFPQFTEEQVGILIASSMISHCPDDPIIM